MKIKNSTRVWVCPTDTVYGLSARLNDTEAITRIKNIKKRPDDKKFITLLSDVSDLNKFSIILNRRQWDFLQKIWPGPVTVIIGEQSFRVPDYLELQALIKDVGPIISTSANYHKQEPVTNIEQAKLMFGDKVDEYLNGGELKNPPSTIIKLIR